ncbi:MAG: fibronectin type III domain-containing protein [Bacteroidia bacterium]
MAKSSKRPLAVFPINKLRRIGDFILRVRTIVLNIGNNAVIFATPAPPLATVTTGVSGLQIAETTAQTRVTGSAAARDLKYDIVLDDVHGLQGYVQNLADFAADEATAISIIQASGFDLKNHGVHVKPPLAAKHGSAEGDVLLVAKSAGARVSYQWQQSNDGITNWADFNITIQAKTTLSGLPPGTRIFFRVRPVLKDGPGTWSPTVSIIVI